jgi:two-component system chemotaxis response regulator CheB
MLDQTRRKIRVMVVDDSMVARSMIITGLSAHPRIEVVGYAINALDAKKKLPQLKPDVITMDVEMPAMSGIEFLKKYLPEHPIPVILVSSLDLKVFDALAVGAVDFVRKPDGQESKEAFLISLAQKVIIAANAKVRPVVCGDLTIDGTVVPRLGNKPALDRVIIGLGASTGGTEATVEVLKRLPADIPAMVIVQHMPTGFTKMYAERLDRLSQIEVREAKNGDELHRGLALVAPADLQCRVVKAGAKYVVSCQPGDKISGHRPSVDALFYSMAEQVTCSMTGIIMTGMGQDGAKGLLAMRQKGAYTIGQDKESSVVYGMPGVANEIGAVQVQASCEQIANVLLRHLKTLS